MNQDVKALRAKLSSLSAFSDDAAEVSEHAALVATLPPELLELGLARTIYYGKAGGKSMKPVLAAMEKRCPAAGPLLQKKFDVWSYLSSDNPWPKLSKVYEAVDTISGVDGARFRLELLRQAFANNTWTLPLRAALETVPSTEVFAALRVEIDAYNAEAERLRAEGDESGSAEPFNGSLTLLLDGTLFEGVGKIQHFDYLVLEGKHVNDKHVEELADAREPFLLHYRVKAPKLTNLLPIRRHVRRLVCLDAKVDLSPLVQFDKLTELQVASALIPRAQDLLARTHPGLEIS